MGRTLRYFWPTAIVLAVIVYATISEDPTPDIELPLIPHLDKLIHAIMFGGLAGAAFFDLQRADTSRRRGLGAMAIICAATALLGAVDEVAQATLTTDRAGDFFDWLADCTGILVAFAAAPPAVRAVLHIKTRSANNTFSNE